MSLKKQALSGLFWGFLQQFGSQIISLVVGFVLARLLMPSEMGMVVLLSVFMSIANVIIYGGMAQSLIRTTTATDRDYSTVFWFNVVGSIVMYLILFVSAPYIATFYKIPELSLITRVFGLQLIIGSFSIIQRTRLTQQMDFKTQMFITLPALIVGGLVGIGLAYSGWGAWSLVYSALAQSAVDTGQYWWYSKWRPQWLFDKEKFKEHFNFGYKVLLSGLLDTLFTNSYTLIIGKYFSATQVAFYNRADTLKQLPVTNLSAALNKVTLPLFSKIQHDDAALKRAYQQIMELVTFFIAPILIFMAVLGIPLFRFLLTDKWLPAVPYFQILCVNGILYPIHSYNLNILAVKGRSDLFLKLEVIKKILIVVVLVVSMYWGIYGLIWGSVLSSILSFFINSHYSGRFLNYSAWQQLRDLIPILFVALLSGFVVYIFDNHVGFLYSDFIRLLVGSIIGVIIYVLITYLLNRQILTMLISLVRK